MLKKMLRLMRFWHDLAWNHGDDCFSKWPSSWMKFSDAIVPRGCSPFVPSTPDLYCAKTSSFAAPPSGAV